LSTKIYANAKVIEGFQIALDDSETHSCIMYLAPDSGTGLGPSFLELCVMSHAGCYTKICVLTANKRHLELKGLKVKVEAVKSDEKETIAGESLDMQIKTDAPHDRAERLHKLKLENCPVGILFERAGVKINCKIKAA